MVDEVARAGFHGVDGGREARTVTTARAAVGVVAHDPVDLTARPEVEILHPADPESGEAVIDLRDGSARTTPSESAQPEQRETRPTLELEEIPGYVQSQLATLDLAVLPNHGWIYRASKRVLDLVIAVPALVLASPIIGILAVLIRLESKGPAVFRQQRVGRDGRVFTFYKFRTMYVDAKERFPELYDYDFDSSELSTRYYKQAKDPRNTRLGSFIRQTTLDELPNLWNVVKGDTSVVGPRPELPEMIRHYEPTQLIKFGVKPGLTCLAACTGRNTLTIDEQIRADVEYVARQSMALDLWIIRETARMVLRAVGAE